MNIGRYTVLGPLGRGGMGAVYKVRHQGLGRIMALKLLKPHELLVRLMGKDAVRAAFLREARILAACEHRNVAAVWDLDDDRDWPFMVLEYLCMNVGALIGEGRVVENPTRLVPPRTALDFVGQALDGLQYLHDLGIVHLDIKPGNLMLGSDGTIKLIDLGLSRLRGEPWVRPRGLKIGSPYYAAPEQEHYPEQADERADLFAAAVVLHRLVTGVLPVDGTASRAFVSDAWREFFVRALDPDPAKRFQSAQHMRQALDTLQEDLRGREDDGCVFREPVCAASGPLRSTPLRTGVGPRPFAFLDELFRPLRYQQTELEEVGDGWLDRCSGLIWGPVSPWPMTWDEGAAFVARAAVVGEGWRLPTVEELVSLLRPVQDLDTFCHRPFEDRYLWVWTADRRSHTSAWFVDVGGSAVLAQERTCRFHARPVRGGERGRPRRAAPTKSRLRSNVP